MNYRDVTTDGYSMQQNSIAESSYIFHSCMPSIWTADF